jgi:hypothetical protein
MVGSSDKLNCGKLGPEAICPVPRPAAEISPSYTQSQLGTRQVAGDEVGKFNDNLEETRNVDLSNSMM